MAPHKHLLLLSLFGVANSRLGQQLPPKALIWMWVVDQSHPFGKTMARLQNNHVIAL